MASIDLNSDLGESFGVWRLGDDEAMLEVVTSANVACGFHAGDPSTLRRGVHGGRRTTACRSAPRSSYPDLARVRPALHRHRPPRPARRRAVPARRARRLRPGGRRRGRLRQAARRAVPRRRSTARARPTPSSPRRPSTTRRSPCSARRARACCGRPTTAGLEPVAEAFADRAYLARRPARAALGARRAGRRAGRGRRPGRAPGDRARGRCPSTAPSSTVPARSLCVHGDTPGAVELARAVRDALDAAGVGVHPFTA